MSAVLPLPPAIVAILAAQGPATLAEALGAALRTMPGWTLYTLLRCDHAAQQNERIYSSSPETHPCGGRKPFNPKVLQGPFLTGSAVHHLRSAEEVAACYANDPSVAPYRSALNIPVIWDSRLIGMVNLLTREEGFAPFEPAALIGMASLARPVLLTA